jgi:hypothetical protein
MPRSPSFTVGRFSSSLDQKQKDTDACPARFDGFTCRNEGLNLDFEKFYLKRHQAARDSPDKKAD